MAKRSSSWKWLLVVLLLGGGLGGWLWYGKRPANDAPDYKTVTASKGDITQVVTANGQIGAVKNVSVGSQVSGIITDIKVDFNSRVTNHQVIAQIDPSTYQQSIAQCEADLASAKAGMELADLTMRRNGALRTNQLISAADYDKSVVDLHQAEATVKMREAVLKKAQVDLERTTIYSPIDGVVISRLVDEGQTVAASFNAPTLFSIANDLRNMRIEAMVSEADVGGVLEGQQVNFSVDAFPAHQFHGEVTQVRYAPITNQNVVNYTTVVEVDNSDLKLRPGMTANASIVTAQRRDVLRVPNSALRFRPPEGALVLGATNTPNRGESRRTAAATAAAREAEGSSSAPSLEGGAMPRREEMRRRFENMTPEQREQMRARWRARAGEGSSGDGGFGGPAGSGWLGSGGPPNAPEGPMTRTVYLIATEAGSGAEKTALKAVTITTGISDGNYTEVIDGLKEGDVVVSGLNSPVTAAAIARPPTSPFGGPFGGGMRPR